MDAPQVAHLHHLAPRRKICHSGVRLAGHVVHLGEAAREASGTVVAYWHSKKTARRIEISLGHGDPVKRLRHYYPTEDAARAAAQGELDKRKRAEARLNLALPGNSKLQAEGPLTLTGSDADMDGNWLINRVEHDFDTQRGYNCYVNLEKSQST